MTSDRTAMPSSLRTAIASDYVAVRRLPSPSVRALALVPFAILTLIAAQTFFQMRTDAARLGWSASWGFSLAQTAIGLALVVAALRESVPGRGWSGAAAVAWLMVPLLVVAAITFVSWELSPVDVRGGWLVVSGLCFVGSAVSALPAIALGNILAVRAHPTRPALVGALTGLGGGLMADAGWRLFCHFSEPAHVLVSHLGGVLMSAAIGSVLATRLWRA